MELKIGDNVIFHKHKAKIILLPDKDRKIGPVDLCLIESDTYGWIPTKNGLWNSLDLNLNKKYWWAPADGLILDTPAKKRKFV